MNTTISSERKEFVPEQSSFLEESLHEIEEMSGVIAEERAEHALDEAIVHDPSLAEVREKKKKVLYEYFYREVFESLKGYFLEFLKVQGLLAPFLDIASADFREQYERDRKSLLDFSTKFKESTERPTFVQKVCGISDRTVEWIYSAVKDYFDKGEWVSASILFKYTNLINPFLPQSWLGYGRCLQEKEEYESAVGAYTVAALLDPSLPHPRIYAANVYIVLGMINDAKNEVGELEKILEKHPSKGDFLPYLEQLREKINIKKGNVV